jgi:phosphate transport system substrate-binding protein
MKSLFLIGLLTALFVVGCSERDKSGKQLDTITSGTIKITVDESLKPLIEAEIDAFEGTYRDAHIEATYTSESEAINAMLLDSARLAIVTRKLAPHEQAVLDKVQIPGRQMVVAKDGIALILHNDNPDTVITMQHIQQIFEGNLSRWKQISPDNSIGNIEVVFDNPNSGILRYLMDTLKNITTIPKNCFAVESNEAVIDYVSKKRNAIGLIGVGWISDAEDSTANGFLKTIRVAGIADGVTSNMEYFQPYQAYIAQKSYPLAREVVIISREARSGLGSGFLTYMASDKGQRVVLKAGLVPATMPVRIVEITYGQK